MTTEKEQLEAEIAKRDARIVELEASKAAADDMFRSLGGEIYELNAKLSALQAHQPASGGAYSSDPLACSGCAAGCFRCRSSAGVVVGALVSALEGIVHDERVPNEVSQDYAALLIEARRLNHCRAQAVPDGWISVEDRLPTDSREPVWCWGTYEGKYAPRGFEGVYRLNRWVCLNNGDYIGGGYGIDYEAVVTHWAPLPAAPSAKMEGE